MALKTGLQLSLDQVLLLLHVDWDTSSVDQTCSREGATPQVLSLVGCLVLRSGYCQGLWKRFLSPLSN